MRRGDRYWIFDIRYLIFDRRYSVFVIRELGLGEERLPNNELSHLHLNRR
jgi:hypothetical protein